MSRSAPVLTNGERTSRDFAGPDGSTNGSAVEIEPGLVLRSRFTLGKRIAGGGIGELYQAIDRRRIEADYPDPFVAIKVLSRNFRQQTGESVG